MPFRLGGSVTMERPNNCNAYIERVGQLGMVKEISTDRRFMTVIYPDGDSIRAYIHRFDPGRGPW